MSSKKKKHLKFASRNFMRNASLFKNYFSEFFIATYKKGFSFEVFSVSELILRTSQNLLILLICKY